MARSFMQFILKPYTEFHHSIFSCLQQHDGNPVTGIPQAPKIRDLAASEYHPAVAVGRR